jgi:hypothetical protein
MHFVQALSEGVWNSHRLFVRALEHGTWRIDTPAIITRERDGSSRMVLPDYDQRVIGVNVEPGLVVSFGDRESAEHFLAVQRGKHPRAQIVAVQTGDVVCFHWQADAQFVIDQGWAVHLSEEQVQDLVAKMQQPEQQPEQGDETNDESEDGEQGDVGEEVRPRGKGKRKKANA